MELFSPKIKKFLIFPELKLTYIFKVSKLEKFVPGKSNFLTVILKTF